MSKKSYLGQKKGKVTVVDDDFKDHDRNKENRFFKLKCDCGNSDVTSLGQFTSGQKTHCGCSPKPKKLVDLAGKVFGRLTVIDEAESIYKEGSHRARMWNCDCDCGEHKSVRQSCLMGGNANSCGCLSREMSAERLVSHGMTGTREYGVWSSIKNRCYNKNVKAYDRYGGRGVSVCIEWRSDFMAFYKDVGPIPKGMEVDRIDNNGHYEPNNVRVVSRSENIRNSTLVRSVNKIGERGEVVKRFETISDAASSMGMSKSTIQEVCAKKRKRAGGFGWEYASERINTRKIKIERLP